MAKTKKSTKEAELPKEKRPVKKTIRRKKEEKKISLEEQKKLLEKEQTKKIKEKKYYEAVGRRKSSIARVRLFTSSPFQSVMEGNLIVNNRPHKEFFPILELQKIVESPLMRLKSLNRFGITVKVKGGGIRGQAGAIRHGIARALVLFDSNFRKKLKKVGYLTRDSRVKERKKFGLKKARRAPQWHKR